MRELTPTSSDSSRSFERVAFASLSCDSMSGISSSLNLFIAVSVGNSFWKRANCLSHSSISSLISAILLGELLSICSLAYVPVQCRLQLLRHRRTYFSSTFISALSRCLLQAAQTCFFLLCFRSFSHMAIIPEPALASLMTYMSYGETDAMKTQTSGQLTILT